MLGEKIKELKRKKQWTTQQLADAANLPVDTVNKILSGVTRNPNSETLSRLAAALDITVDELLAVTKAPDGVKVDPIVAVYERMLVDAQQRERELMQRADRRFYAMLLLVVALIALTIYLIVDALHGNWGIFRYAEQLRSTASGAVSGFGGAVSL